MSSFVGRVRRAVFAGAAALAVVSAMAAPAAADIAAYNAAMQRGDMPAAWSAAKEVWATWDRTKPVTPIIAREFGFAALMSGDLDEAVKLAEVAVKQGASKETPDAEPWIAGVLLKAAEFRKDSTPARRTALRKALAARQEHPGYDLISIIGWQWVTAADWGAREWRDAEADAASAISLMQRGGGEWNDRIADAEVMGGAAAFMARRNLHNRAKNEAYDIMADAHDRIVDLIETEQSPAMLKTLWKAKWMSEAWAIAIEAYINSVYEQVGSKVDTSLKARPLRRPGRAEVAPAGELPLCEGELTGPRLLYPGSKEYSGMTGSVIARLSTDETGKVVDVSELASVPAQEFFEPLAKQLSNMRWQPAGSTEGCTLKSNDYVFKVRFYVGGSGN